MLRSAHGFGMWIDTQSWVDIELLEGWMVQARMGIRPWLA